MPRRIVLDTDIGTDVDDALALALTLASPELELVAVTTVAGDTMRRARIAARLLALADRADVPVHAGCERALSAPGGFAWFGHEGDGILEGSADAVSGEPAVDALLRLFGPAEELELVAIGPLTNVAVALEREPAFARRVARLTVMGGWLRGARVGGTLLPPSVDYNLCSDAGGGGACAVRRHPDPPRLRRRDGAGMADGRGRDGPRARRRPRVIDPGACHPDWAPVQRRLFSGLDAPPDPDNAAFLHDPLAVACVHDESFCTMEELAIAPVVVDGDVPRAAAAPAGRQGPSACGARRRWTRPASSGTCAGASGSGERVAPGRRSG